MKKLAAVLFAFALGFLAARWSAPAPVEASIRLNTPYVLSSPFIAPENDPDISLMGITFDFDQQTITGLFRYGNATLTTAQKTSAFVTGVSKSQVMVTFDLRQRTWQSVIGGPNGSLSAGDLATLIAVEKAVANDVLIPIEGMDSVSGGTGTFLGTLHPWRLNSIP